MKGNKNGIEWYDHDIDIKIPNQSFGDSVQDYFYTEMVKQEKKKTDNEFSMTYNAEVAQSIDVKKDEHYLKLQYEQFKDILLGLSYDEFSKSILQMLQTGKSNDALQNELFEMLGFNAFELISVLLDNRKSIVSNSNLQQQGKSCSYF